MKQWFNISSYLSVAVFALLMTGCSDEFSIPQDDIYVDIKLGTRAEEGSEASDAIGKRTYRAVLFNPNTGKKIAEGTYYDQDGTGSSSGMLSPWATDDEGKIEDASTIDKSKGLFAKSGTYSMCIVSPAWKIEELIKDRETRYGFKYPRKSNVLPHQRQYVSDVIPVEITARGEIKRSEKGLATYYDCIDLEGREDAILKERRSKVHFDICANGNVAFTLSKVQFLTQAEAYYAPLRMEYISDDETNDDNLTLFSGEKKFTDANITLSLPLPDSGSNEDGISYSEKRDNIDGTDMEFLYLLSQKYSQRNSDGEIIYVTPELVLTLSRKNENNQTEDAVVRIPLAYDAEPHRRYYYKVVVESVYVKLKIYVDDWIHPTQIEGLISAPIEWHPSNAMVTEWESNEIISSKIDNNNSEN